MRLINKGKFEIYEQGRIEIGFSTFGATIGLYGTLRSLHNDKFIQNMNLEIIRKKDSLKHHFNWGVFRPNNIDLATKPETLELPTGFIVSTNQPKTFNVQFHDIDTQTELKPAIEDLKKSWNETVSDIFGKEYVDLRVDTSQEELTRQTLARRYLQDFSKGKVHLDAYTTINRLFYWEPGKYLLKLFINIAQKSPPSTKEWEFVISKEESDQLRLNVISILREVCSQRTWYYYFAYANYEQLKSV